MSGGPAGEFTVTEIPLRFGGVALQLADSDAEGFDIAQEILFFLSVGLEVGFDEAVEDQVRIAANGGGEVAVFLEPQPEMAHIEGGVGGPAQ